SISCIAGQPEYVGVIVTVTPSSVATASRTIPSSTMLMAGTSGSLIWSSIAYSSSLATVTVMSPRHHATTSPRRAGMRPREDLHLAQQVAKMLGVPALPAAALHVGHVRHGQRRAGEHVVDLRAPPFLERARVDALARLYRRVIDVVGEKELAGVTPQLVDGVLRACVALVGAVAERDDPLRGVTRVVARFLERLR